MHCINIFSFHRFCQEECEYLLTFHLFKHLLHEKLTEDQKQLFPQVTPLINITYCTIQEIKSLDFEIEKDGKRLSMKKSGENKTFYKVPFENS